MSQILYSDSQITMYKQLIVINKYYFPLATSKTILVADIERVTIQNLDGVSHRWGVCAKYLNNWFPLDSDRKKKTKFIQFMLKGKKTRPSITPDNPQKVIQLIWKYYTSQGQEFIKNEEKTQNRQNNIKKQKEQKEQQSQQQFGTLKVENIQHIEDS